MRNTEDRSRGVQTTYSMCIKFTRGPKQQENDQGEKQSSYLRTEYKQLTLRVSSCVAQKLQAHTTQGTVAV
jgi:hypothetical protein